MFQLRTIALGIGMVLVGLMTAALADDWPQWRGPDRDGHASSAPESWPEELASVWNVDIGEGHAGPVVVDGRVYVFSRQDDEEVARCLHLEDGREIWSRGYPAPYEMHPAAIPHGKGPKSTPVVAEVDDRRWVATLGISGILSVFDAASGELAWQKNFADDFENTFPLYGTAMSPLIHRGMLIAHVGGSKGGAIKAFDVATGEEKWSWNGDGPGYASPVIVTADGREQMVTQSETKVVGLNPADGKLLSSMPYETDYVQNIVTPTTYKDLVIISGLNHPTEAYRLVQSDGGWKPELVWENADIPMYMSSPVVVGDRLFGLTHRRKGQLFCVDAGLGESIWNGEGRIASNAALIAAGNRVLVQTTDGELLVLDAEASDQQVVARYKIAETETWAHPALVNDRLLTKDRTRLSCWRLR